MRKIVVSMWTTLDGFVAGPDDGMDWLAIDDDMMDYETALVTEAEALLLGRGTHADFAHAWPEIARDESAEPSRRTYARRVDAMPKFVVSESGRTVNWAETTRLSSLGAGEISELKSAGHGDLVVYGSLGVIASLQAVDAIDEYHLLVHPTAIGAGKALFTSRTELQPISSHAFPSGVALLRFVPRRA